MSFDIFKEILKAVEEGRSAVVATVLQHRGSSPGKVNHKMLVYADGRIVGTIGGGVMEAEVLKACAVALDKGRGDVLELLISDKGEGAVGGVCGGKAMVALEVLPDIPRILICGGGHIAEAVGAMCEQLGFLHEVHEDRAEMVDADKFPAARRIHVGEVEDIVSAVGDPSRFSHVLLVSRGHATDRVYARALARSGFKSWVGMLGSQKKKKIVWDLWLNEDALDPSFVDRVECPVGLPIGARTPAEIALSIMARIVEDLHGSRASKRKA